ncbi:uncharacterized protein V6R79_003536 [Siganus canaliculatus]
MGSRLKQNPDRTFYWFFEAACPVARDKDPGVLFQFPEDFSDEESFQTLPRFCFPYDIQRTRDGVAVQHFTFVLTDLEGCQRFGFCRLTNSTHTCICILSYLPWFEVFYKLLNNLADYLTKGQTNEMKALLAALYKQPLPLAAGSVTLQMVPYFIAPDPRSLPSIPENRNLTELIVAVDVGNLLQIYASMLFERRILIFASKLSTLTSCVHALSAVLYPMYWQHIFIPVLPPHLLDYCCAPMPYLIGVHTSLSEKVRSRGLEEVVILNVDTNTLETPFDDLKRIPSDVMAGLKVCLKRQAVSPGCGVSRAFLKAQALLFGGYKDALQGHKEGDVSFNEELFLDHKSSSMRHFLQSAIHLQFFKQFIDGRLDILSTGKVPDDLFEEEILRCETAAGRSKSYQQLVGNLKKGGGALILNVKSKANMTAKGLAKSGLKNLLMHKVHDEDHLLQRGGSVSHRRARSDCLQNRLPITQHFGKSRPRRPVHKHRDPKDGQDLKETADVWDGAVSRPVDELDSEHQKDEEEDSLLCDSEEMDLLGEIFDTLSSRSSHERGLLYGTRSLDLFGSDSHDYITRRCFPGNPSQESLSLSISGSGSLHSWNLETTEEPSDLTEDSDWVCPDTSLTEEGGLESSLAICESEGRESGMDRQKQEEAMATINGNQEEEIDDIREVKAEEETKSDGKEKGANVEENIVTPTEDKTEDEDEGKQQNQRMNVDKQEIEKTSREELRGVRTEEPNENQEEKPNRKLIRSLDTPTSLNPHNAIMVEEDLLPDSPRPLSVNVGAKPSTGPENISGEVVKKEEGERQPPSSPRVLSAVAHFQSQVHGQRCPVKPGPKELLEPGRPRGLREKANAHRPCDSNTAEERREEEDLPSVKVSELKKRFEA